MSPLLAQISPGLLASWLLAYLRVQACLIAMPGWGDRLLPARLRIALALSLTPLARELAGGVPTLPEVLTPAAQVSLVALVVTEASIGFALGLLVRIAAHALSMASAAIAATTSLSQLVGGPSEAAPHPIGNLFDLAGLALLMALGYPIFLIEFIAETYALLPVGQLPDAAMLGLAGVTAVARAFGLAMVLASPFILGGFLYQCLQGIVSRVMPSLPVVFVGAPAALLLALVGIAILAVPILSHWADQLLDLRLPALRP